MRGPIWLQAPEERNKEMSLINTSLREFLHHPVDLCDLHLPAVAARRCLTGCLWDLRSGSSAAAGPFCPERQQPRFLLIYLMNSILEPNSSLFINNETVSSHKVCVPHQETYLVYIHGLLLGLYGLHLDVLAELYRLLLRLHCHFHKRQKTRDAQWQSATNELESSCSYWFSYFSGLFVETQTKRKQRRTNCIFQWTQLQAEHLAVIKLRDKCSPGGNKAKSKQRKVGNLVLDEWYLTI